MAAAPAPASAFEHGLRRLLRPDETVSDRDPPLRSPSWRGLSPRR